jgi:hypothetical protein
MRLSCQYEVKKDPIDTDFSFANYDIVERNDVSKIYKALLSRLFIWKEY